MSLCVGKVMFDEWDHVCLIFETEHTFDGIAPERVIIKQRETSGTTNTLDEYYFYDGFGRLVQDKKEYNATDQIVKDVYYGVNSKIANESNPYFAALSTDYTTPNSTINKTIYKYDALSRVVNVTNPDGTLKRIVFDRRNVTVLDENNHKKVYWKDAYDEITAVEEHNNGSVYTTNYSYDANGAVTQIRDHEGNFFNFSYDSLGRKTSLEDPDLGVWNYTYDANGNLIF